jgi:hypothetical protein
MIIGKWSACGLQALENREKDFKFQPSVTSTVNKRDNHNSLSGRAASAYTDLVSITEMFSGIDSSTFQLYENCSVPLINSESTCSKKARYVGKEHVGVIAPIVSNRLISLSEICRRINRSKSWAYENGIVPLFNDDGTKKQNKKTPAQPWVELPMPQINVGKRAWLESCVEQWLAEVGKRTACDGCVVVKRPVSNS